MAPSNMSTVSPLISMSLFEWRIGSRSLAWRLIVFMSFLYGCSLGKTDGAGAGAVAYATGETGWQMISLVAIVWMSMLATRDGSLRTRTLVFSKPQPGERMALAKFVGGMAQNIGFLVALFAGSVLFRLVGGAPVSEFAVYVLQFWRALGVIFFASAASYTLALLSDSVIAGILVGLYIVLTMAGRSFLGKYYYPAPLQNVTAYVALGGTLLCIALRFYARKRRGATLPSQWLAFTGVILAGITIYQFNAVIQASHDPPKHLNPALDLMATQDTNVGRKAAGFLLPDQNGVLTGIAQFKGNILVISLWSPADPDSAQLLSFLNAIQDKNRDKGVQVVAVCLSEDNSAARTIANGEGLHFPVVTDWGTTSVPEKLAMSPIASAYRTTSLPMVAITDRRHRIVNIMRGTTCYDGNTLNSAVQKELAEEQK